MKKCSKCGKVKPLTEFNKELKNPDKLSGQCKSCRKKYNKKWRKENENRTKEYREKNKEHHRKVNKRWRLKNREYYKRWYRKNREKELNRVKMWYQKNKDKRNKYINKYTKEREAKDRGFRLNQRMRSQIYMALRKKKCGRSWEKLVGYTVGSLAKHLESQFDDKMSWNNYGKYWHIDHIIPKSWFSYEDVKDKDFQKCWALNNLQPLEAMKNLSKNNRYIG